VTDPTIPEIRAELGISDRTVLARTRSGVAITEREMRALDLLVAGATYRQIALAMGMKGHAGAYQLCARALAKRAVQFNQTTVHQARALYLDRLGKLLARWMPLALGSPRDGVPPDPKAADIVLRVMEREALILGLNAPFQVEQETVLVVTGDELEGRRRKILEHLAEVEARRQTIEGEFHVDAA